MKYRAAYVAVLVVSSALALGAFGFLVVHDPVADLAADVPGTDGAPPHPEGPTSIVRIGESFRSFAGTPSAISASWPRFRGAEFDNTDHGRVPIPTPAPGSPWRPAVKWTVDLGEGHAGAAVANGRVYVLDYDERRQADALRCFSLDTGAEIWRRGYTVELKRNHGYSRTVPAVSGQDVVTIGPAGQVMCCDAISGSLRWGVDLVREMGAVVPLWYTGQCPLIDDGAAVIAVGGESLLVGLDLRTGKRLWATSNPHAYRMSHSSIMVATVGGARTYLYAAIGGIVGVSAEPSTRGRLLWETTAFDAQVIAPSPVCLPDGRVFVTAGYGAGSIMLAIDRGAGGFNPRVLYRHGPTEGLACEHQTPLLYGGMLFGILPKDAGPRRGELACWDPEGRWVWSSGQTARFGLGPYLLADGKFLILSEDGTLTLAEASTAGYRPLASAKILPGPDAWAPMALASGLLIARDTHHMVCVDLAGQG